MLGKRSVQNENQSTAIRWLRDRASKLEARAASMELNQLRARELLALLGDPSGASTSDGDDLEDRLIALFDFASEQSGAHRSRDAEGGQAWRRLVLDLREVLACRNLRPEYPEGRYQPCAAFVESVVSAASPEEDRTIAAVKKPAIVRVVGDKAVVIRPARVVVRRLGVAAGSPGPTETNNPLTEDEQ